MLGIVVSRNFGPLCNCGTERMHFRVKRTNESYDRSFYWCLRDMNHVGEFIWANEIPHVNAMRPSEAYPIGRCSTGSSVMLCACCECNIILFLAFVIIMLNM